MPNATLVAGGDSPTGSGFVDGVGPDARFSYPAGMALSNDGRYAYICDYGNRALRRLDLLTTEVTTLAQSNTLFNEISHCAVGPVSGDIWCTSHGYITRVSKDGGVVSSFQVLDARGIALNASETVIHISSDGGAWGSEESGGVQSWVGGYMEFTLGGGLLVHTTMEIFVHPTAGMLAPNGYFYAVNQSARNDFRPSPAGAQRCTPGTGAITPAEGSSSGTTGGGVAGAGADGKAWADENGETHLMLARNRALRDLRMAPDGASVVAYETLFSDSEYAVWGVLRDLDGVWYFADNTMSPEEALDGSSYWENFGGRHSIYRVGGGWTVGRIGMGGLW